MKKTLLTAAVVATLSACTQAPEPTPSEDVAIGGDKDDAENSNDKEQ
jgi:hypothetical protein